MNHDEKKQNPDNPSENHEKDEKVSLGFLFWTFLKIGSVSFGGFMALISVIENVIVHQRKLIKHEDMLEGISLANILPGPQAVNVVAFVGYRLRKGMGALVSTTAVLIPTFILVVALTFLYFYFAELKVYFTELKEDDYEKIKNCSIAFLKGFTPAVTAIIISVAWRMGKKNIKDWLEIVLVITALLIVILFKSIHFILSIVLISGITGWLFIQRDAEKKSIGQTIIGVIFAIATLTVIVLLNNIIVTIAIVLTSGLVGWQLTKHSNEKKHVSQTIRFPLKNIAFTLVMIVTLISLSMIPLPIDNNGLPRLAITFSGLSVILFGGGFVFIPMIQDVVVNTYQWLSLKHVVDGIAIGQITPGPILISAAFIGQKVMMDKHGAVMGVVGAFISTVAIFAPPAIIMITASKALDWLKQSEPIKLAMIGIRCGVIGMIFAAAVVFGVMAIPKLSAEQGIFQFIFSVQFWKEMLPFSVIFISSLYVLIRYNVQVVFIIPAGGLIGLAFFFLLN